MLGTRVFTDESNGADMSAANAGLADYESYLLRLWPKRTQRPARAWLQSVTTGQVYHFTSTEALCAFLAAQAERTDDDAARHRGAPDEHT